MSKKVYVVGVGMTKFLKPSSDNPDYPELAKTAINRALMDSGVNFKQVEAAVVGYVYGDSTCGNRYLFHHIEPSTKSV
jgi:acetyl-CoA acetyltransferase